MTAIEKLTVEELDKRIAIHEASHAVAYLLFRKTFKFVEITGGNTGSPYLGMVDSDHTALLDRSKPIKEDIYAISMILTAGHMGDCIHLKMKPVQLLGSYLNGAQKDMDGLIDLFEGCVKTGLMTKDEIPGMITASFRECGEIMREHWPLVTRIADELYKKRKLTYEECKALVTG